MGAAGVGVALFVLLSLGISWLSGDKERGALEDKIKEEHTSGENLQRQLQDSQIRSANDAQMLKELENRLNAEIGEKKRLERALAIEESQKRFVASEGGAGMESGTAIEGTQGVVVVERGGGTDEVAIPAEEKNRQDIAMLEAKLKAATDAKKEAEQTVKELEEFRARYDSIAKKYGESGVVDAGFVSLDELQRRNKALEAKLKESEEARNSLEEKLAGHERAFSLARTSLRNAKLVLEDEKLNSKLKDIQTALDKAKADGFVKEGASAAELVAVVKEADLLLEQAKARRAEAEAVLNQSADKDLALLIRELAGMYASARREKDDALMTVGLMQAAAKERSKGQASSLESRLMSLEQNRRGIEGQLTDAMMAVVKLDETAQRLEAGLKGGESVEGMMKLQSGMETLRQARENVRLAMENVKGAMQANMDTEAVRVRTDIAQLSGSVEQMAMIGKGGLMGKIGLKEEPMEIKGGDTVLLSKKLQGLNLAIDEAFKETAATASAREGQVESPCEEAAHGELEESYIVKKGDSLWKIAAKKKIYSNPWLWPILYKYNLKTVYNPDLIYPNYTLKIKRGMPQPEKEFAVRKAKRHTKDKRRKGYIKRLRRELTSGMEEK
ncbi:MAG: LysM peptidoglycan-binding domain-containing protein [Deltaproteobacteria bacterium]|nr:LysM peptidoglycan-binding domain-containing protein [Deltaproteobacteria bacterium]